ncbi:MAG TPA: YoaK family protein [Bradyrhizobium sp.]|uniref:YoaK family protein n=1 Tax=Bradyrhizobium sp. TaxID=376 RepID=UPI002D7E15C2|nr:YoaK family protein [Bradyrhizobium sp.]HET7886890.1 YoaK family protein [Bradyrhizobium sp.]
MASAPPRSILPLVLSFNAGFVDTAGFLALQGLFTAHVTGNFVTLGASLALGTSGAIAKLLALPVFCAVVIATRWLGTLLSHHAAHPFTPLLALKVLLLIAGSAMAVHFGPFHDGDSWQAISTGMVLVAAMAIQNAVHRVHLSSAPPSTLMTGTTTQVMLDIADVIYPREGAQVQTARLSQMATNVVVFAVGCGAAALLFARFGVSCFVVPPVVGALALIIRLVEAPKADS